MPLPREKWFGPLRRFRHRLTPKLFGRTNTFTRYLKTSLFTQQNERIWSRLGVGDLLWKERSTPLRQHFGPKSRIPDLFQRQDQIYLALEAQRLQWHMPPPIIHHDLLDAAARVGRIEERVGYTFKDKMKCIEAVKVTSSAIPLYFRGVVHQVDKNNRMALLGDRVLSLALCEIWFQTGNTTEDYSKMSFGSETRAVLAARGHALGIHKNMLLSRWPFAPPSEHNVAETFEAILGAVYLDSGNSIETVKRVMSKVELDRHELLKANTESQDMQERKERAALRTTEQIEREKSAVVEARRLDWEAKLERFTATKARRPNREAELLRQQTAKQAKRQVRKGKTTTEGQRQRKVSETAQTRTRGKGNTPLTHEERPKSLADCLIEFKRSMKKKEQPKIHNNSSEVLHEEEPAKNRDRARDSRAQRRAAVAADKLTKEGELVGHVLESNRATADSKQQRSTVSRIEDQEKANIPLEQDNQNAQTLSPAEMMIPGAEDQQQQNSAVSTATIEENPLLDQGSIEEELVGLEQAEKRRRRRWWYSSVMQSFKLKRRGEDVSARELYHNKVQALLSKKEADGLNVLDPKREANGLNALDSKREANGLNAPDLRKEADEMNTLDLEKAETTVGEAEENIESRAERRAKKRAERRARLRARKTAERQAQDAALRKTDGYEEEPAETQPQNGPAAPLEPSEETTRAPLNLLPEPPTTTVTKADSVSKNMGPALTTAQQEKSLALKSGQADAATATATALIQELPSDLDEIDSADASATSMDLDKEIQVRTKDVEELERTISRSHDDTWRAAGPTDSLRMRHKRLASARRSLRNSIIFAEQLTRPSLLNRTAIRKEDLEPESWKQKDSVKAGTNARPFVRFELYESNTERLITNISRNDAEALDRPRSEHGKKA